MVTDQKHRSRTGHRLIDRSDPSGRGVLHVHVDPTGPKLVAHLFNALLPCCWLFRTANPAEVVVALVARALVVVIHQTVAGQELLDVGWHRVRWSGPHSPIKTQSSSKCNADPTPDDPTRVLGRFAERIRAILRAPHGSGRNWISPAPIFCPPTSAELRGRFSDVTPADWEPQRWPSAPAGRPGRPGSTRGSFRSRPPDPGRGVGGRGGSRQRLRGRGCADGLCFRRR